MKIKKNLLVLKVKKARIYMSNLSNIRCEDYLSAGL